MSDGPDEIVVMAGWMDAARRVVPRYTTTIAIWFGVMALAALVFAGGVGGHVGDIPVMISFLAMMFGGVFGILGACVLPVRVFEELQDMKRQKRLDEVMEMVARVGDQDLEEVEPTRGEKLRQVLHDQALGLAMATVLEIIPLAIFFMALEHPPTTLRDWFVLLVVVGFIPALAAFMVWREMRREDSKTMESARAERRLREAVKSKEQLVGGLVLDEHARQIGGELTMQVNVGGLEVHEEVVLDVDEREEARVDEAERYEEVGR